MKAKKRIFNKIPGICIIKNRMTKRKYVGHSINVGMRWYTHLDSLEYGKHVSKKMQEDYDEYGPESFVFYIVEKIEKGKDLKDRLVKREQEYMNEGEYFYNTFRASKKYAENMPNFEKFNDFIYDKWLVPGSVSKKEMIDCMIYKPEDKLEIIEKAHECRIINTIRSRLTFMMIIRFMINEMGYTVESGRKSIKNKRYTYKLITGHNPK